MVETVRSPPPSPMPLAALTPAAPPLRVQARQVRSAGPAVPGAHRPGHRVGCRCSEAQGRAFRAREAPVRTPCAPLSGLIRGLRALPPSWAGAQVRRGKEPGLGRAGGGRGSSRSQWKDRETISSEVCHVGSTRPPAPPLRAQPAAAPSLGRGPGTRVRWRTRRPGAALPGPPSSHLHACDQREGRRGQREPPVPQAARLHTQRCPQPRAAGAPPATRRALGRRMRGSASGSAAMG